MSVPTDIYLLKFSNINSRIKWKISSKLEMIETQDVFLVSFFFLNFEYILYIALLIFLTLNM